MTTGKSSSCESCIIQAGSLRLQKVPPHHILDIGQNNVATDHAVAVEARFKCDRLSY